MQTTTTVPFTTGQRVTRKFDGKAGTVVQVKPYATEASDTYPASEWSIAVRLDADEQVWSGTEHAWEPALRESTLSERLDHLNRLIHAATAAAWSDGFAVGKYVSNAPGTAATGHPARAPHHDAQDAAVAARTAMWGAFYDLASDITLKTGQ